MEPTADRVRRQVGIVMMVLIFAGMLGGVTFLGRIVGDAVGTAYVGDVRSAEDLPPLPTSTGLAVDQRPPVDGSSPEEKPAQPTQGQRR
jgi:hypothetical protein